MWRSLKRDDKAAQGLSYYRFQVTALYCSCGPEITWCRHSIDESTGMERSTRKNSHSQISQCWMAFDIILMDFQEREGMLRSLSFFVLSLFPTHYFSLSLFLSLLISCSSLESSLFSECGMQGCWGAHWGGRIKTERKAHAHCECVCVCVHANVLVCMHMCMCLCVCTQSYLQSKAPVSPHTQTPSSRIWLWSTVPEGACRNTWCLFTIFTVFMLEKIHCQ